MMIKPIEVTKVIIDKTLHAVHHPRHGNAPSFRPAGSRAVTDWISLATLASAVPGDKLKAAGMGETVWREAPRRTS